MSKRSWRGGGRSGRGDDPGQLHIEWAAAADKRQEVSPPSLPAPPPLVQRLPWDFCTSFPQPTAEAIEAGIVSEDDAEPEQVRAIHEELANELLAGLRELDAVLDARRRGVHPGNNKAPTLTEAKERLAKFFETEPGRLERWWETMMQTYEQAFGPEASDAFGKALRARHAGVEVIADPTRVPASVPAASVDKPPRASVLLEVTRRPGPQRIVARLPVPRPLPAAVAAGRFGQKDNGKPVRPGAHEVRAITEDHAQKLIDLLNSLADAPADGKEQLNAAFTAGLTAYAEDFGERAAEQLEAYLRREAGLVASTRRGR